jgi:glyoxylase-like metal-dependent hydrolase (beta-lactamase superfamily II)
VRAARRFWKALDAVARARDAVHVILTLHYHERSAGAVAGRYRDRPGAVVWAPAGSEPRLDLTPDRVFAPGHPLPGGIEALASGRADEVVLWLPRQRALVSGDVLLGAGPRSRYRICPASWLPDGVTRADVAERLAPLADLPVELLVPLHGALVDDDAASALRAALDAARAGTAA